MIEAFKLLEKEFIDLEIPYDQDILNKFEVYMELVLEWNEKVNLTAITDKTEFIVKHFVDSIMCAKHPAMASSKRIIDIGTGAGFPGIPLALIYPDKQFVLVDSVNKKLLILKEIIIKLSLNNVKVIHGRAEDMAHQKQHREQYDICVSRAVAKLQVLSEYCLPFIKKDGYFIAYKGRDIEQEILDSEKAIGLLGGKIDSITPMSPDETQLGHRIIYIRKIENTSAGYPRKAGMPQKQPL